MLLLRLLEKVHEAEYILFNERGFCWELKVFIIIFFEAAYLN